MLLRHVENQKFIRNFFSSIPELGKIEISELSLREGGPHILMSFTSKLVPENLPKKYAGEEYNSSFIKVRFDSVENVSIKNWLPINFAHIEIFEVGNIKKVRIISEDSKEIMVSTCGYIDLLEWTPLLVEE